MLMILLACTAATESGADEPATISLTAPADGATVCGTPLQITVEVGGLILLEPAEDDASAAPGTGHIDVTLNGQDAAMAWEERIGISEVADGLYQLKVELSNADHTAVEPYAGDFVYVTVDATRCPEP